MTELETIEKKIDNMLSREDMFEERYQKSKIENDITNKWIGYFFCGIIAALLVGVALGYYAGYNTGTHDVMTKLLYQRLGIFV